MPSEVGRHPPGVGNAHHGQRGSRCVAGVTAETPAGH